MIKDIQMEVFKRIIDEQLPILGKLEGVSQDEIREKLIIFFSEGVEGKIYDKLINFEGIASFAFHRLKDWLEDEKDIDSEVAAGYCEKIPLMEMEKILERLSLRMKLTEKAEEEKKIIKFPIK